MFLKAYTPLAFWELGLALKSAKKSKLCGFSVYCKHFTVKAIITDKGEPGSSATHAFLRCWQVLPVCVTVIAGESSTGGELVE